MESITEMTVVERPLVNTATVPVDDPFDSLSIALAKVAEDLNGADAFEEQKMRAQVVSAVQHHASSRRELGRVLSSYRTHWKAQGSWVEVCNVLARALHVSSRTLFRVIDDYHRVLKAPTDILEAFESAGIKTTAPKNAALMKEAVRMYFQENASLDRIVEYAIVPRASHRKQSSEERQTFKMKDALRKGLQSFPPAQRFECLRQILNEVSFLVLDHKSPFTLHITPEQGPLMIDGRIREQEAGTQGTEMLAESEQPLSPAVDVVKSLDDKFADDKDFDLDEIQW